MTTLLFSVLTAAFIGSLIYFLLDFVFGEGNTETRRVQSRLERLLRSHQKSNVSKSSQFSSISALNKVFKRQRFSAKLSNLIKLSGLQVPVSVFVLSSAVWASVVYFAVQLMTRIVPLALGSALLVAFLPYSILVIKKRMYIEKFTMNLPDALVMMKTALKAGQGVQSALQMVAEEGPKPVSTEFSQVVQEIELGSQLNEALNSLYRRIQSTDLRILVLGIFIQQEVGGNLTELFEQTEKTIRDRLSLSREISALSAQGKMTGLVLMCLPMAVAAMIFMVNPNYFAPLLEADMGRRALGASFGLQIMGGFVIRKITTFRMVA